MDIAIFFPFLLLIGVMFIMSRSAKNKQRQAMHMRDSMEPGTGIRTIGGLYAQVKEVREDTVLVETEPGVHALYAKNAIGAVLDDDEYRRIVSGEPESEDDTPVVPDDASSLVEGADETEEPGEGRVELDKADADEEPESADPPRNAKADGENGSGSTS